MAATFACVVSIISDIQSLGDYPLVSCLILRAEAFRKEIQLVHPNFGGSRTVKAAARTTMEPTSVLAVSCSTSSPRTTMSLSTKGSYWRNGNTELRPLPHRYVLVKSRRLLSQNGHTMLGFIQTTLVAEPFKNSYGARPETAWPIVNVW